MANQASKRNKRQLEDEMGLDQRDVVDRVISVILDDISERQSWGDEWDAFDEEVQREIVDTWRTKVRAALALGSEVVITPLVPLTDDQVHGIADAWQQHSNRPSPLEVLREQERAAGGIPGVRHVEPEPGAEVPPRSWGELAASRDAAVEALLRIQDEVTKYLGRV